MTDADRELRWSDDPPDEAAALEARAARYRKLLGVEDLGFLVEQLSSLSRAERRDSPYPRQSYDLGGEPPQREPEIRALGATGSVTIVWSRRPRAALWSWGMAGRCVRVVAEEPFGFARLRIPLRRAEIRLLFPGTVMAARWSARLGRFCLVPASGYSEAGEYLYGQIATPGVYAACGLPRDPRILLALRLLAALAPWARAGAQAGLAIAQPLLDALSKQSLLRRFPRSAALRSALGCQADDIGATMGGGFCDFVRGPIDAAIERLPELDLLEAVDPPRRAARPVPEPRLPPEWPVPIGRWRCLGPANVTGRIKSLAMHPANGHVLYAGAAGGGVWKTVNGGRDWFATMGRERSLAIGGLAIAPSAPDVLYAATGEWTGRDDRPETPSGLGAGVYRTGDGGRHWIACAPIPSTMCTSVAIDPRDPDRVFVGGNRGLHCSADGGLTWRTSLADRGDDGARAGTVTSVAILPDAPARILAGVHGRGIFISEDGGESWRALTLEANGLPTGEPANAPKIAIGRGDGARGSRLVCVKMDDAVFTSTDGGNRFGAPADMGDATPSAIPWCNVIAVHPRNEALMFAAGTNLHRSADGGRTWRKVAGYGTAVAGGQHAVAFDPVNARRVYLANDGGLWASADAGVTWRPAGRGIVAAQAYHVSASEGPALRVGVSLHDVDAHVFDGGADWRSLGFGEAGSIAFAAGDPDEVCADSLWSNLMWFRPDRSGPWRAVEQGPDTAPNAPQPLAVARDRREAFLAISVERERILKYPGRETMAWPALLEIEDAKFTAVAVSRDGPRFVYAGDTKGRLWFSQDGGARWRVIWSAQAPAAIAHVAIGPDDPRRVHFATADTFGSALYRGEIHGRRFAVVPLIGREAPGGDGAGAWSSLEHPRLDGVILALRRNEARVTLDGGAHWRPLRDGLPNATLMRAAVRDYDGLCFVATHGAGVWAATL
jgi:photosystem II stability/assembly factor-like uncharacterized protein